MEEVGQSEASLNGPQTQKNTTPTSSSPCTPRISHDNAGILGCNTTWTCKQVPNVLRNMLSPPSELKMKAVGFSETLYISKSA